MRKKTLKTAIAVYGVEAQMVVAIEELAELQKELTKQLRGKGDPNHMAEEIADVRIMLEQLVMAFDLNNSVDSWEASKLVRLENNLVLNGN